MARLGEVFTITSGGTPDKKKSSYYTNGTIPWVKTGDLKNQYVAEGIECITEEGLYNSSAKLFPPQTVLVAMYGATIGACSILPYEASTNQACAAFLPNEKVMPTYLYYFLLSKKDQFVNDGVGGAQPNISAGYLKNVQFDLIPIQQQKDVVERLDKVVNLIALRKEQLAKLDQLVKARFVELFGDPVENPYGWEQTTLKNIAIGKLSYGSGASACEYDGNIRYVRITDIDNSGRLNNDVVSPSVIDEKYILNDGDILFARSGATVGKSYRYRECDGKCLYAGYLIRLVPNIELVLPDYVFYYTKTSYYERFIASNMKVVAQPNINAQQYGDLTICIPPMELQKDFLSFIKQTDKSKLAIQQSLEKLKTLKKALMQQYFG